VLIHSSGQIVPNLSQIEGITLGASEEIDEVAGGALYFVLRTSVLFFPRGL
jgi:hypothetical protein